MLKHTKLFMLSLAIFGMATASEADTIEISVGIGGVDPESHEPIRRSPAKLPKAYIDGRQLSFEGLFGCQLLEVLQDDEVVYSAYLPAGSSTVSLPESLSGEYEIRLLSDNSYYFFGFIHFQ